MLENKSLEQIGVALQDLDQEMPSYQAVRSEHCRELCRRLEWSREKASTLLDFHYKAFQRRPSAKHWNELYAMMYVHQALQPGGWFADQAA